MVFSRGDGKRRHHKYVPDPLEENPKRIKVHAQRKFAQGSGMNSPVLTPIKEKEKSKPNGATSPPELLPSKRPATEDFLNFLCFRGTNTVPTKLDAFNESNFATSSASSASKQTSSASSGIQKIKTKSSSNQEIKKKLLDCRHAVPKGNAMRARTASDERQSIRKETIELRRKAAQRRSKPVRKTHPAILKRLGAARLRAGLRSGGQLPPGSDVGIKTDRKPRRGRPPRRRRRKAIKKEFDELPELEIKEEEESEEEIDEQPSKMPSMKLRTRGASNSPAQSSRNLNVSTRPSRKTKEAATLYMEMLTKDLRSPDEEFDDEYLKDIPELPVSIKKENEGVKEMSIKRNKQLIKNKAKHGKSPKLTKKSTKVKEEVDSELDEDNEPLLTRTQKSLKNDVSKLNTEKCLTRDIKNTNKKKVEDSPKILKRSVGKRELRTLKEKRSMNDDHIESDKEEDEPSKVASKKIKEGKSELRDSDLSIAVTKIPPKRIEQKQEILKKNQKESKKAKKILPAKKLKENEDETINIKKQKEKNDKSMEEYEETDADKIKTAERRNSRKQVENEDLSPRNVIVAKSKPGKRPSLLKKGEKAKIPKLSKEMIKTESDSGSDQDEENEPLLKRKQKMQKKDSIPNQKRTSSGSRYMRNSEPKIEMVMKDAPKKRGRKSLKGNMNVDDKDNLEDSIKPKDTASKIMIEEKCDVNKPVSKQETNITETIKETIPKRGRRISNIKKVNLNDEKEDSKAENTCETISSDRKNTAFEKGLDVTNRVNITELRSKKLNDDSNEISIPSKVKSGENKISKKVIADEKEMNVINKVKIADIKTKKIVEDELLVDIKEKRIDHKVSKNEKVLVEDKSIDIINRVKIMEYKASKKSISEEKGPDAMNLAKLGDNKIAKKGEEEKGIDFTNRVKIPEYEVSKKLNDESNKIKKTVDSKKNKCTVGIASNQENIENDIYNENDQRKKKISIETSDASEGKITKLKRITRQSVGPTEFKEQNEDLDEDKKTVSDMLPSILPNEDNEKPQSRRSSIGSKNQGNKKNLETKISGNTAVEKVKVASIGKRKSGGDRDSCDTVHSGSSGMIDCKVVLESLGDIGRDVQRSSKKFKSNSKVTVENIQEIITEERQSKDNISSTTCSSNNSNEGPNCSDKKSEHRSENKDVSQKPKQSISETWRQAFKNAKLPKPGQLSPVPHTVKPFVRQKLTNSSNLVSPFPIKQVDSDPKGNDSLKPQKLPPNLSPFKAMLVNQNQRSVSPDVKRNSSPAHKINFGGRDSPFKRSEEMKADFKKQETPAKSFTQLQYEKRSSEFINSLLDPGPSILPAFDSIKPFKKEVRKDDAKDQKTGDVSDNLSTTSSELIPQIKPPPEQGKHLNLPLAVEHTLRKMSPVTVSKKPIIVKPVIASERRNENNSSLMKQIGPIEKKVENPSDLSASASASASCSLPSRDLLVREPTDLGLMAKKKVNMTAEEINRWLNDDTSSGIEHKKDCGIFENNQCECGCGFRTCKEGTDNSVGMSELVSKDDGKIDHGVVEPPVQLKELDQARKYEAETISTCKVEDYKEKLLTKNCTSENKMAPPKPRKSSGSDKFKSNRSMTDEEMCDFDFRFERTSTVSPRESMSDLSSITPRDDCSSSSEVPERKIFQQRRLGTKRPSLSKSPSAFSAENESSIYAFKSDPPPSKPFRRGREKSGENEDDQPSSSSIAVQVNIENETESVLECSTQTDREEEDDCERDDRLFYIPLPVGQVERGMSQGVAVKVGTEGPDQRVIMRAKLVTKADRNFPSSSRGLLTSGRKQRPEQKVRPLYCREPTSREHRTSDQGTTTDKEKGQPFLPSQSNQTTQINQNSPKGPDSPRIKNLSKPQKVDEFPPNGTPATLVEAPTYYPSEKEFQDPLEYIERLTPLAQSFGICRIVPPKSFKPECKVTDEMRFTAYNQYVHKMMERWGPNVREMSAIRKYLKTQSISLVQVPSIGSMEVDLPRLYQTVQQCGGLKEVIEKKRWARVADTMRIPKSAQDRVTKLDDIYCKYLLPYDTLSHGERSKLLEEVEDEWKERQKRLAAVDEDTGSGSSSDESVADDRDECIAKGRSMPLSAFYRTARNTMAMWFKDGSPSAAEVEAEYWKHVSQKTCHVCVHSGSIDSGTWGYGFPTTKTSATSRHPWNLKVLTNSPGSILRSLGPVMGITVPTLHVGMLFSSCCWYRDPHALPWIEYLHTGANKIWYGVPDSWCSELREAMYPLLPRHTRDRTIWLPSDTMMVPPTYLLDGGASLCRVVQEPGQFILVFPKSFTSSISTGYVVSESVYFAQPSWLNTAEQVFKDIHDSCEPPVFSLHKLLFNVANDTRSSAETLIQILPMVKAVVEQEVESRKKLEKIGLTSWEKVLSKSGRRNKKQEEDPSDLECDTCRGALFLSMVTNSHEDCSYCIQHAVEALSKDQTLLKYCKLKFAYDEEEMEELIEKVKNKIETKTLKKQAKEKGSSSGSKN